MTRQRTMRDSLLLAALLAVGLTGCAADDSAPTPTDSPTPPVSGPTAEPTPDAAEPEFRMPTACADALPASRIDELDGLGMELLAGPDGRYGDSFLADPTPEQLAGGITCIWGEEEVPENSVTISIAPVTPATRDGIVTGLVDQALNIIEQGDLRIYARTGDSVAAPAIINLVRPTSWISVITGLGGEEQYDWAVELADDVSTQVGAS